MENSHESWMTAAWQWLADPQPPGFPAKLSDAIASASGWEIEQWFGLIVSHVDELPLHRNSPSTEEFESVESEKSRAATSAFFRLRSLLQMTAARTLRLRLENDEGPEAAIDPDAIANLAAELSNVSPIATAHCLQILAAQGDEQSLVEFCRLLKRQILEDEQSVAVALSPLFQWPPPRLADVFQMIGEDIWRWQLLGPLLDLAGHALRKQKLAVHPLVGQKQRVRELLSATVQRLSRLEENPKQFGDDVPTIQRVLNNAIALTVSLCDTVGLINDQEAEGQLNQAMALSHRRVQTEAAGALARLGNPEGRRQLIELAQDPAARLRALAYAEELGLEDSTLDDLRAPLSIAEAEAISWLADRERFGVPPAQLELLDQRAQYWPSYEAPQSCFLFRFTYHFAGGDLSNLIIAGPLVYAFQTDLRQMELDDVYGLFAGWQAEHEEIYEVPWSDSNSAQCTEVERLLGELSAQGLEDPEPLALTFFFGERAVLANAKRAGQMVCAIHDGIETLVYTISDRQTSLTPDLILALYRGRKLLRTFN